MMHAAITTARVAAINFFIIAFQKFLSALIENIGIFDHIFPLSSNVYYTHRIITCQYYNIVICSKIPSQYHFRTTIISATYNYVCRRHSYTEISTRSL